MQIKSNYNTPSFGSKKLLDVTVKSITSSGSEIIPAQFTQLQKIDFNYVDRQTTQWCGTKYGRDIIESFKRIYGFLGGSAIRLIPFYAIEKIAPDGTQKIYGLAETANKGKSIEISYLQSSSKIPNFSEKIKGVGTMLLYGIVKTAQRQHKQFVGLESTADNFYRKCGWQDCGQTSKKSRRFELHAKDFITFFHKVEKDYNLPLTPNE